MKKFDYPTIIEIDDVTESVYAIGSGNQEEGKTPGYYDWEILPRWAGHNGGGHSELYIKIRKPGTPGAAKANITITAAYIGDGEICNVEWPGGGILDWTSGNVIKFTINDVNMSNNICDPEVSCQVTFKRGTREGCYPDPAVRDQFCNMSFPNGSIFNIKVEP